MAMGANYNAVFANAFKNELIHLASVCRACMGISHLSVIRRKMIKTFLNDMVSVKVLDQIYNSIL